MLNLIKPPAVSLSSVAESSAERDTCLSPLARMCVESYHLVVSSQQRKKGPDENEEKEQNHVNGRISSSLEEWCMVKIALIFRLKRKVLQICGSPVSVRGSTCSACPCANIC